MFIQRMARLALALCCLFPAVTQAQQAQEFDAHTIHYNAITTDRLTPEVARAYGIQRSSSRAMLNVTILNDALEPIRGNVDVGAINLTGQRRDIELREIEDPEGAIYYIGVFPVHHMETYNFTLTVRPENAEAGADPLEVRFRQQFYTQ